MTSSAITCLIIAALLLAVCLECGASSLIRFQAEQDFASFVFKGATWDASAGGITVKPIAGPQEDIASFESQPIAVTGAFDQAIISWNASTAPGSYLRVFLSARVADKWTSWYNMGVWNTTGCATPRTSLKSQQDDLARVDTDILILKSPANAIRLRVELDPGIVGASPVVRFLSICTTNTRNNTPASTSTPPGIAWGKELDVPQLCQLSIEGGSSWCSPTSVAMVLGYWAKRLNRPELAVSITQAASGIYDEAWGGTGNWTFNTAYAGEFSGIRAFVTRFETIAQIERWVLKGVPVIVSLDYNKLNRRNTSKTMGHLVVVLGFTHSGNPIINDPWAHLDKGDKVRKIFTRTDLERSWLGQQGSYGTVYLIYPEELASQLE